MLGDNIIYDVEKDFIDLKSVLLAKKKEQLAFVVFGGMKDETISQLQQFKNIQFIKADISDEFEIGIENINNVILVSSIGNTDAKLYKRVKQLLERMNKEIIQEVLV